MHALTHLKLTLPLKMRIRFCQPARRCECAKSTSEIDDFDRSLSDQRLRIDGESCTSSLPVTPHQVDGNAPSHSRSLDITRRPLCRESRKKGDNKRRRDTGHIGGLKKRVLCEHNAKDISTLE